MRVTRPAQVFLAAAALTAAGFASGTAGAQADDAAKAKPAAQHQHAKDHKAHEKKVPTFKQFKKKSAIRTGNGVWIVNGDEPVGSLKELRGFYREQVARKAHAHRGSGLIVNTVGGSDDVWDSSTLANLTYCVSDDFGADKQVVVDGMAEGAALWEGSSSAIDFVYDSSADADCTTDNDAVLFSVEPTTDTSYIARAFFPSSPDSEMNVLVNPDSLQSSGSWTPGNILGHELGHTLGFRHEHTRPEAGTCFEDNSWRALTPYDSVSIMHYPQCNGGSDDLTFSSLDAQGVASLYGS
jgi:hypothetical protein